MFQLPPLPYPRNALEPHISEETMNFHYGKHHQGYINKLNALAKTKEELSKMSLEKIIKEKDGKPFNLAAQIWNHTFYWNSMSPKGGAKAKGKIAELIKRDFGSFENFVKAFLARAGAIFGSGWCWVVINNGKLDILDTHDAGNPLRLGLKPLLVCDVWEHAYYIDYRNARANYLQNFLKLVNWDFANSHL